MQQKIEELKDHVTRLYSRRVFHIVFISIVTALFIIFFTSRLWLPAAGTVTETPAGTSYQAGSASTNILLKGWKLHPEDGYMLVDIGIEDMNIRRQMSYSISAQDAAGRQVEVSVLHQGTDFVMLAVPNATKQKVVCVTIQAKELSPDDSDAGKGSTKNIRFIALIENVAQDPDISTSLSGDEYVLLDMHFDLELLELRLQDCKESIQSNMDVIENANIKIAALREKQAFQTKEEIGESDRQITQLLGSITTAEKENAKLGEERFNLSGQIENKGEIIDKYRQEITK